MSIDTSMNDRIDRYAAHNDSKFADIFSRLSAVESVVSANGERARVENGALKDLVTQLLSSVRGLTEDFNDFREEHIGNIRERIVVLEDREASRRWREQAVLTAVIGLVVVQAFQLLSIIMRALNKNL